MEPITQALLGAATAELAAGRALRGRALGWGAIIGMSPDLDVLLGPLRDGYGAWLYHRGTTHSLWFGFVLGPLLGWILWRWRDMGRGDTLPGWIRLCTVALVTHPILDGFTAYGTQFFAPFLRDRFAWNGVAIVDPFYSLLLGAGVLCAAWRSLSPEKRHRGLIAGLGLSSIYLAAGLAINQWIENDLRLRLAPYANTIERVRAYPTFFQPWLRSFVIRTPDAMFVGLHSWPESSCPVWHRHDRRLTDPSSLALRKSWEGELLEWFADGDTIALVHPQPGGRTHVRIEDVRYGWASDQGRGMWGVEAVIDANGELLSPPTRIPRPRFNPSDLSRMLPLLMGELPKGDTWERPIECGASAVGDAQDYLSRVPPTNELEECCPHAI